MFDAARWAGTPKYQNFTYWFIRHERQDGVWAIYKKESNEFITHYDESKADGITDTGCIDTHTQYPITSDMPSAIVEDFKKFQMRPEYCVGNQVDVDNIDMETATTCYEMLLVGIMFIRAQRNGVDPDSVFDRFAHTCLDWIRTTDMYTAPASTKYHDAFAGGLLYHSLKVYNKALDVMKLPTFISNCTVILSSVALVALVHDWCKIDLYEPYMRNVKNEETGKWEQVQEYRHNQRGIPLGHGVSSMFLASKCFKLSVSESLAIRWHMGFCRVADSDMNELQLANETHPLVHLLQFADQLAIVQY